MLPRESWSGWIWSLVIFQHESVFPFLQNPFEAENCAQSLYLHIWFHLLWLGWGNTLILLYPGTGVRSHAQSVQLIPQSSCPLFFNSSRKSHRASLQQDWQMVISVPHTFWVFCKSEVQISCYYYHFLFSQNNRNWEFILEYSRWLSGSQGLLFGVFLIMTLEIFKW